ncbi:MAG: hypothetical protein L3J33_03260 [Rhodobacteraceae bacterium]|nr:hypothetical protein [Paracoccaceae bacterium]
MSNYYEDTLVAAVEAVSFIHGKLLDANVTSVSKRLKRTRPRKRNYGDVARLLMDAEARGLLKFEQYSRAGIKMKRYFPVNMKSRWKFGQ